MQVTVIELGNLPYCIIQDVQILRLNAGYLTYVSHTVSYFQTIDVSNFICLYGIHERYLNNLCQRYSEGLITDFYRYEIGIIRHRKFGTCSHPASTIFHFISSYFKETWCVALYHDRFKDLRAEIREILSNVEVNILVNGW
jgi:hypothetical protein